MSFKNTYTKQQIDSVTSSSIVVYAPSPRIGMDDVLYNVDVPGSGDADQHLYMKNTKGNLLCSIDGSKYPSGQYLVKLQTSLNIAETSTSNFTSAYTVIEFEDSDSLEIKDFHSPNQQTVYSFWIEKNFTIPFSNNGTTSKINVYVNFDQAAWAQAYHQYQFIKLSSDDALPFPIL